MRIFCFTVVVVVVSKNFQRIILNLVFMRFCAGFLSENLEKSDGFLALEFWRFFAILWGAVFENRVANDLIKSKFVSRGEFARVS